jgi:hypothetical protein
MAEITPTVDSEFAAVNFQLTDEERKLLRQSLIEEGCREPVVVWNAEDYPILDGHNRHAICTEEGIDYPIRLMTFPDRAAAKLWIYRVQGARRNLTDAQRSIWRARYYMALKLPSPAERKEAGTPPVTSKAELAAKETGVSPRTIHRDLVLEKAVAKITEHAPELAKLIERGGLAKTHVCALIERSPDELRRLGGKSGKALKRAAEALAKQGEKEPRKAGAEKKSPKIWRDVEGLLGKARKLSDTLNRQYPHDKNHRLFLEHNSQAMRVLGEWKKAVRP